jgi:UDP-2,4-diacetamido-2,4,6-trideoxy-beta-L-altropyranose hydrolase
VIETLILRADASQNIGSGHVMRCLALAQAWQEASGQVIFVMGGETSPLGDRMRAEGLRVSNLSAQIGSAEDAIKTAELALQNGARWIVADGYHFASNYQQHIKNSGIKLLLIDDYGHADHYLADVVLNQNIRASDNLYKKRESYTKLLLGTNYVLLRKEFLKWRNWRREIEALAVKVLVTFGGADPHNLSLRFLYALKQVSIDDLQVAVVIGPNFPHHARLQSAVDELDLKIDLKTNATNMPELIAWADLAISAGGSTCWELAYMGLPSLVIVAADNQRPVAVGLAAAGVAENLGWHDDLSTHAISEALVRLLESSKKRLSMSQNGRKLVDGEGVARVGKFLLENGITLRRVRRDDCALLWDWANAPEVRAASFSSEPIPWEEHVRWFESKINDGNCFFFLAVNQQSAPIGQVRFDREGEEAIISVSIAKEFRGMNYGILIIEMASRKLFEIANISQINAYIKMDNDISKRAFVSAGYKERYQLVMHGHPALQLTFTKTTENESFI